MHFELLYFKLLFTIFYKTDLMLTFIKFDQMYDVFSTFHLLNSEYNTTNIIDKKYTLSESMFCALLWTNIYIDKF